MYIGIDVGTSGIKAILVDDAQTVLAAKTEKLTVSRPHDRWSEQNPEDWWTATGKALDALRDEHPREMAAVKGIGLSGQQHGAVLLDAEGRVLRPCILWNDTRSTAECTLFTERLPEIDTITGNLAMPGFTAPKLLWVRKHEPEIFARTAKVLLPKAWLRYRMTGEMIEDMSDASGSLWLDVGHRKWSEAALEATYLTPEHMPRLCEGSDAAGRLKPELAQRWGMDTPPILAGSAGDNAAGAIGLGATHPGDAFVSLGTSGVVWNTTGSFRHATQSAIHSFCHALPNTWHQMGVTLSAAASLAWWSRVTGTTETDLLAELPEIPNEPSPVTFMPYLSGERTPHNDADIRGAFLHLSQDTTRAIMTQSILEGVAYSFRDALDGLTAAGSGFREADVIGGGSRSKLWSTILASVMDVTLHRLDHGEQGGAFGAARLARLAVTAEDPSLVCLAPKRIAEIKPDPTLRDAYARGLTRYRALYPALKPIPA